MATVSKRFSSGWLVTIACLLLLLVFGAALLWRVHWLAYLLHIPAGLSDEPAAAIVVLHGTGGDARTTRQWLGFDDLADDNGFVVIYPHSSDGQWDAGAGVQDLNTGEWIHRDDANYIIDIIAEVAADHRLDRGRIYLVGVSDGAAMAYRLSCEFDQVFAALASVAATIPVYANRDCLSAKPMPALFMHGTRDIILPWQGKKFRGITIYRSLEASVDWWAARNGCGSVNTERVYQNWAGKVDRWIAQGCDRKAGVVLYRINNGGHSWPLRPHPDNRSQGEVNRDIDATRLIVEWLLAHP